MLQQDSIAFDGTGVQDAEAAPHYTTVTPAMVLSWLPRNATPAQQDSAIQSRFKPSEIRWSQRPDTLHLPGHDKGHNMMDIHLPQYYREGFFSKDTLFHPELPGGRYGEAGDPIPYSARNDSIITGLLLVSFVMAVVSFANARDFLLRQAKNFFFLPHEGTTVVSETANELRFQSFQVLLTSLLAALLFYFYTLNTYGDTFMLSSPYYLIVIYMAAVVAYFLLKAALYTLVNITFFDGKRNVQWMKSGLFIVSVEGGLLYPAVLLQAYFDWEQQNVLIYFVIVLIIVKILTIYKSYIIFFRQNVFKLQIILYFCTLEIIPLIALWGMLEITANILKINF